MFGFIFCPYRRAEADTDPEEPNLIWFFLNNALLTGYCWSGCLWPVITWRQGLMSTCLLRYEELTLGGADELPVRRKREMSLLCWIKPASFLSKVMELSSFLWPITICFISPTNWLPPSLHQSFSSLLCSGHAGKAGVSEGLVLKSALFSVKVIIHPFHYYFCLIRKASFYRFYG